MFSLKLTGKYLDVFCVSVLPFFFVTILESIRTAMFSVESVYLVVALERLCKLKCVVLQFASINLASVLNDCGQDVVPYTRLESSLSFTPRFLQL